MLNGSSNATEGNAIGTAFVTYGSPILIVVGFIGNGLILVVLNRREVGRMPSRPYLIALALADIVVLGVSLLSLWLENTFYVSATGDAGVKIVTFLIYFSVHSSTWLVVTVTIDRFYSVCFPFQSRNIRQRHRVAVVIGVVVISALCNMHIIVFLKQNTDAEAGAYYTFRYHVWTIMDFVISCAAPCVTILACNLAIIVTTRRSIRAVRNGLEIDRKEARDSARLTRLLITLNLFFIVTTAPVAIFLIYLGYLPEIDDHSVRSRLLMIRDILLVFSYLNNTMNFILYSITGKQFRRALFAIVYPHYRTPSSTSQ